MRGGVTDAGQPTTNIEDRVSQLYDSSLKKEPARRSTDGDEMSTGMVYSIQNIQINKFESTTRVKIYDQELLSDEYDEQPTES